MATYVREPRSERFTAAGTIGGTLAAFGLLLVIAAVVTAVGAAIDAGTDFTDTQWRRIGIGGAAGLAAALFVSFLFGGYIAGRMAFGYGLRNGLAVFLFGLLVIVVAAVVTNVMADPQEIRSELQQAEIPTSGDVWTDIGIGAAIAAFVAMLAGSLLGGWLGGVWRPALVVRPGPDVAERDEVVDVRDEDRHVEAERAEREGPTHEVRGSASHQVRGRDTDEDVVTDREGRVVTYADGSMSERPERDER